MNERRHRVLFLCTGNAARSQMAEAIARAFHAKVVEAHSAGSRPAGWVHPLAVRAMEELGVDMSGHRSKSADEFDGITFDLVVTLCESAAKDCPTWPHARRMLDWSIEDPSFGEDDPETRFQRFRETRNLLIWRIAELAADLREGVRAEAAD